MERGLIQMKSSMKFVRPAQGRIQLIDEIRGFSILCMILYHGVYDVLLLFPVSFPFFFSGFVNGLRTFFAGMFIFISGAACRFSRSNLRRGLICFGCGMVMTLATALVIPKETIVFGILHMLGASMILFHFLRPLLDRMSRGLAAAVCIFLFLFTWRISQGFLGIYPLFQIPLPEAWYQTDWLSPLGIYSTGFSSGDYYALFPWLFLFLTGSLYGCRLKEHRAPEWIYRSHVPFLAAVGRYTIYIYLIHQPVIFGILLAVRSMVL